MECSEARELLSAYHDAELSAEVRSPVAEHVESCSRCAEELALFGVLSAMARGLDDPEPPPQLWADIEAGLDAGGQEGAPSRLERLAGKRRLSLLVTAATVLIAAGVWFATRTWRTPGHHGDLAADFGEYLEQFATDPDRAQNALLVKYEGQAVDLSQATRQLGYRPAVAAGLPKRYSLEAVYLLKMPCCTCVQSICRRDDGHVFAIFEHDEEQPVWFGDRPRIETQCHGCACSIIQTDRGLVASWKANKRHLTVVGARGLEEIADLVGHLKGGDPDV